MSHVERLGNQFSIPLEPDEDGYIGRECPVDSCLGYFKIKPGTGLKDPAPCHCPYCGHTAEHDKFFTPAQLEYAQSVVFRQVADAFQKDLKSLEFDHKPKGGFGIGISLKVKNSPLPPVRSYQEKQLETKVVCDKCTLHFAIYGVFGWCPDCGAHNSLHILIKNLELARKELTLAETLDTDLSEHLIGDALENIVSAFDGFGRELCSQKGSDIRFQNITAARRRVQETFSFDFAADLDADSWAIIVRAFEKRHLLAHKMGVVDEDYVRKAADPDAVAGRRVRVSSDEVAQAIGIVESLGQKLFTGFSAPTPPS
ncbi:hypothetical protein IVB22_10880 [Bradyrhizobium sp. 190]|uniref:hypothetical protein n=1 Tax=Bradyrhizobium sp. 190 TaxID=2782658 RepID=UPI001FFABA1B|nr:hypothetical protein [Bradyrhizobium sp. 190]MCK1513068.1 hypothetical protein [Bradyrhizobium sp. 190]